MAPPLEKILKRTASGGSRVLGLSLLLVLNDRSESGLVLCFSIAAVLMCAVFELMRMGRVSELKAGLAWYSGAALSLLLLFSAREEHMARPLADHLPLALSAGHQPSLWFEALCILLFTLAVHGLQRSLGVLVAAAFAAACIVWLAWQPLDLGARLVLLPLLCGLVLLGTLPALVSQRALPALCAVGLLALWLLPALPVLAWVHAAFGTAALVSVLALSKIGDTAGYYGGMSFGKRHPFPGLSPGKTEWGCVASLVAATLLGGVLALTGVLPELVWGWPTGFLLGAVLNLAAQAGDLFESAIKRRAGVKDSSGVFGPSGGLLDQLDSLLFSLPMAAATWPFLVV